MYRTDSGFTLVEVVVAAVITFSAISIGYLAVRSAVSAVEKVTAYIVIADALPPVMDQVKRQLLENKPKGSGRYNQWVTYSFGATQVKSSGNVVDTYDGAVGNYEFGFYMLFFLKTHLVIRYENGENVKTAEYIYDEIVWMLTQ
jgi:Tfp pilus assembly major pilin PilA